MPSLQVPHAHNDGACQSPARPKYHSLAVRRQAGPPASPSPSPPKPSTNYPVYSTPPLKLRSKLPGVNHPSQVFSLIIDCPARPCQGHIQNRPLGDCVIYQAFQPPCLPQKMGTNPVRSSCSPNCAAERRRTACLTVRGRVYGQEKLSVVMNYRGVIFGEARYKLGLGCLARVSFTGVGEQSPLFPR